MRPAHGTVLLPLLLAAAGCGDAAETLAPAVPVGPAAKVVVDPAEIVVHADLGLATPESVAHDPVTDLYLVSNMGDPFSAVEDGFIARLHPDGSVESLHWITGLVSPSGITIEGRRLYVVDRDGVRVYDLDTADLVESIAFPAGVSFLNDICGGPDGRFYVTDSGVVPNAEGTAFVNTGTDAIYTIRDGAVSVFASGEHLGNPNGCLRQGARNLVVTRFNPEGGIFRSNPSGKTRDLLSLPPGAGQNDSALPVEGGWLVTSWGVDPFAPDGDAVYLVAANGAISTVLPDFLSPGDMGYDATRRVALVPSVLGNAIAVVPVH